MWLLPHPRHRVRAHLLPIKMAAREPLRFRRYRLVLPRGWFFNRRRPQGSTRRGRTLLSPDAAGGRPGDQAAKAPAVTPQTVDQRFRELLHLLAESGLPLAFRRTLWLCALDAFDRAVAEGRVSPLNAGRPGAQDAHIRLFIIPSSVKPSLDSDAVSPLSTGPVSSRNRTA